MTPDQQAIIQLLIKRKVPENICADALSVVCMVNMDLINNEAFSQEAMKSLSQISTAVIGIRDRLLDKKAAAEKEKEKNP